MTELCTAYTGTGTSIGAEFRAGRIHVVILAFCVVYSLLTRSWSEKQGSVVNTIAS